MNFLVATLAAWTATPALAADSVIVATFRCADRDYSVVQDAAAGVFALRRIENGGRRMLTLSVPDAVATTPAGICVAVAEVCGADRAIPAAHTPYAPGCLAALD